MVKEDEKMTNIHIRPGNWNDFDALLEQLINFYSYEVLSVHLGLCGEEMRKMLDGRLRSYLTNGVCTVAEIDGKIEGAFLGRLALRSEKEEPDYLDLPEHYQVIEKVCQRLRKDLWIQIPPKFDAAIIMDYGMVTTKAQGDGIGDRLLKEACRLCCEKGVRIVVSESLTEKTAKWMLERGFAVVNRLPLHQFKDKQGRSFFEGRPEKTSTLLVAFLDNTTGIFNSKL